MAAPITVKLRNKHHKNHKHLKDDSDWADLRRQGYVKPVKIFWQRYPLPTEEELEYRHAVHTAMETGKPLPERFRDWTPTRSDDAEHYDSNLDELAEQMDLDLRELQRRRVAEREQRKKRSTG